jgi:signal peptidase I
VRKLFKFLLWTSALLVVSFGIARLVAIRVVVVPDDDPYLEASLEPTLSGGDVIVLWRLTPPSYGDLVLCPEPQAPERIVIGRIVGGPGDTVDVSGAEVKVNNKRAPVERLCGEQFFLVEDPNNGSEVNQTCDEEELGGHVHPRGNLSDQKIKPIAYKVQAPQGHYVLISDNRLFPFDSRDYGPAPQSSCKEFVVFRLMSGAGFFDVERRMTFIR